VYLIARVVAASWAVPNSVGLVMAIMALVTMFMALSLYFAQDDLKRLLAYSTIAHLSYVFLGISLGVMGSTVGFRGGILHIVAHAFGKSTLFLVAGAVAYVTGSRSISKLSGLARSMPLVTVAFFVGALTVTGVPPFAAFWSKFYLLAGALQLPGAIGPIILILVLVESLISFGWMLYVGQRMFFGEVSALANVHSDPPWPMSAALVILMVMCLAATFVALPFINTLSVGSPLAPISSYTGHLFHALGGG
jgi:hydrogenase-4 component D